MWPSLITKAKQGGLNVIDTYVFWNVHEPQPNKVNPPYLVCVNMHPHLYTHNYERTWYITSV